MAAEEFSPSSVTDGSSEPKLIDSSKQVESSCQVLFTDENRLSGILCSLAVCGLAKQQEIDLSNIEGSGKDGRILKEDILNYVSGKDADTEPSTYCSDKSVVDSSLYEDKTLKLR